MATEGDDHDSEPEEDVPDWRLLAAVVGGVALVLAAGVAADAAGLTGAAAFAVPALVGVAVGAGIGGAARRR